MTMLTVPLIASSPSQLHQQIEKAGTLGADAIEVRLDYLREPVNYISVVRASKLPIIWTNRHASEGGRFAGPEHQRIAMLLEAIEAGGEYIDIEYRRWSADSEVARSVTDKLAEVRSAGRDVKLILSVHDFESVPDDLEQIVDRMADDADIVKFAVTAVNSEDNFRVFDVIRRCSRTKAVIGLAMGSAGRISRILAGKLGCHVMFASLGTESASAPGQLTIDQLKNDYNWDRIGPETLVFGVVGHPVGHSLSPPMHNAAYRAMGLDAVYLAIDVPQRYEDFERFVDLARSAQFVGMVGFSVTIPHKSNAIRYLKEHGGRVDPLAERIGAVNTLRIDPDRELAGFNTDYLGVLSALEHGADLSPGAINGKRVAVLGAGGVARAIVAAVTSAGGQVGI